MFIPVAPAPPLPMLSPSAFSSKGYAVVRRDKPRQCQRHRHHHHHHRHPRMLLLLLLVVVAGMVVIIIVVLVVVVGVWLGRVRELRGLTDASQCRVIEESGLDVTLICQHHDYTDCTSPAITNVVTSRIPIGKSDSCVYAVCMSKPSLVFYFEVLSSHCSPFAVCRTGNMSVSNRMNKHPREHRLQQPRHRLSQGMQLPQGIDRHRLHHHRRPRCGLRAKRPKKMM